MKKENVTNLGSKNQLLLITAFLVSMLITPSCKKDCQDGIINLTSKVGLAVGTQVLAGVPFNVQSIIPCVLDVFKECSKNDSETANASTARMAVNMQVNGNYNNIGNDEYATPAINAGSQATSNRPVTFNDPGNYQVITFADTKNNVSETNEGDNNSNVISGNVRLAVVTITVLPNPHFKKATNAPIVEFGKTTTIIEKIN